MGARRKVGGSLTATQELYGAPAASPRRLFIVAQRHNDQTLNAVSSARAAGAQVVAYFENRLGIATMLQWPSSPRSQPRNTLMSMAESSRSVLERRC